MAEKTKKQDAGALWEKQSNQTGNTYYTGTLVSPEGPIRVIAFINKDKKNDKEPDLRIYVDDRPPLNKTPEPF